MTPRMQRLLLILLMVYFCLIGGTFYTERSAVLRILHQVLTAAVLVGWLLTLWREKRAFPGTPLDRPLLATGIVWFAAALFAADPRVSLEYTWPILVNILAFCLLVDLMRRGRQRWIMEALFTVGAVVVLLSGLELVAWYFGLPLASIFVQDWPSIGAGLFPPIWHKLALALNVSTMLGNFTATLIPLTVAWALTARQRDLRGGLWLLAAGLSITLLATQSRGALMALATSSGVLILTWLLRPAVRARFPQILRPLLAPRLLIGATGLAGMAFVAFLLYSTLGSPLRTGDENRLDLWRSAIDMTLDHPLLGVGPYQYGSALRTYGEPALADAQDRLVTAHNLPLHTLAEGGLLGFGVALWLGITFARTWWQAWQTAAPGRRRRLEGGLAALFGFGVQSFVDTFTLTALLIPVFIIAAYTVAGNVTRAEAIITPAAQPQRRRWPIYAALALIVTAQVAFLPVHAGNLAQDRALRALALNDLPGALAATRAAHAADPALGLYPLQEAYILGLLADQDAPAYLDAAITAHESGLQLNPTWDLGWHNLGALYAQAGRYEDAVQAAATAVSWNPANSGYALKEGEYLEILGRAADATAVYIEALRRHPNIGSSGFWTDPAHPERQAMLAEAVAQLKDDPKVGLRLATEAGDLETATAIAQGIDQDRASYQLLRDMGDWAIAVDDPTIAPCPECYFLRSLGNTTEFYWVDYNRLAEIALHSDGAIEQLGLTAEQIARTALFTNSALSTRSWYVLAEIAAQQGADDATIDALLARAVPPLIVRQDFAMAVYGRPAAFDELPQARTPQLYRYEYEPWYWLADRLEAEGNSAGARRVYEALLHGDPYLWDIRQKLEALPPA